MPNRYLLIAVVVLVISSLNAGSARAQSSEDELKSQQRQQAIEGNNPLVSRHMQVGFSGSGSATFMPKNYNGAMAGPTPLPSCTPTVTQVGFNVQCQSDPDTKSASTCRGSMSFFGFNETRTVVGEISTTQPGAYSLKLSSPDDEIQGCELSNIAPVSSSLGNVITMAGCGLNIAGCAGDLVGAGADHALTSSGSVILTPSD
jgi:hypothetical protein